MRTPPRDRRPRRRHGWREAGLLALAAGMAVGVTGCGRPKAPDLRSEMGAAISSIGVRPVYPLSETLRVGSVLLVDGSAAGLYSGLPAYQEGSLRITDDMVEAFERARRRQYTQQEGNRFAQSRDNLGQMLVPASAGRALFRQTPAPATDRPAEGALALAAMPGFSLASVDQLSFGAFIPDLAASFFAAIGLRRTSYLRMEADGVEVAELPVSDFLATLATVCRHPGFMNLARDHEASVAYAYNLFEAQRQTRQQVGGPTAAPQPLLAVPRRVFYLRGVRFIIDDSRAAAAFAQAAVRNPLPAGTSPVGMPALSVTNVVQPVPGANVATSNAQITALSQQLEQLRSSLASGTNMQLGGSIARATATGVEFVQLFDRPLAFGYQAQHRPAGIRFDPAAPERAIGSDGLAPVCAAASPNP